MIRSIVGFHQDEAGDWVAELSCFHNQHVRHRPPLQPRPWVLDETSRTGRLGTPIECPLCDRAELPDDLALVGRAGPWVEDSVPTMLRQVHRTPTGRWGKLFIRSGSAGFQFDPVGDPAGAVVPVAAGASVTIPPDVPHRVVLTGPVRLELELWGRPTPAS